MTAVLLTCSALIIKTSGHLRCR